MYAEKRKHTMFLQIKHSYPSIDDINFTLYDTTAFARYPGSIRPAFSSTNKYAPRGGPGHPG